MVTKLKTKTRKVVQKIKESTAKIGNRIKAIRENSVPLSMTTPNYYTHYILWVVFAFLIVFLLWAKFAVLEEVTVAEGTVTPITHIQIIQSRDGGVIKSINVKENQVVDQGQLLATLDPTQPQSAMNEATSRETALEIQIARLSAEVDNKPFVVDNQLQEAMPGFYASQLALYNTRQQELTGMKNNYNLARKELNMTLPVMKDGAASEVDVINLQREALGLKSQIDDFYAKSLEALNTAKANLAALKDQMVGLREKVSRTELHSPVKGIVKEIKISTIGGVVLPGAEIMSIIPLETNPLVEAQVKPSQIGFIKTGEPATIKITAYDYSVYGGLQGIVKEISADTIKDPNGRSYYLVKIQTDKNFLGTINQPHYIIPGMTASVDILTGKRTVLEYILTPLIRAKDNALRER